MKNFAHTSYIECITCNQKLRLPLITCVLNQIYQLFISVLTFTDTNDHIFLLSLPL